eukprot:g12366.t1
MLEQFGRGSAHHEGLTAAVLHPLDWLEAASEVENPFRIDIEQTDFLSSMFKLLFDERLSYVIYIGERGHARRKVKVSVADAATKAVDEQHVQDALAGGPGYGEMLRSGGTGTTGGKRKNRTDPVIEILSRSIAFSGAASLREIKGWFTKLEGTDERAFFQLEMFLQLAEVRAYRVWITLHANGRCDAGITFLEVRPRPPKQAASGTTAGGAPSSSSTTGADDGDDDHTNSRTVHQNTAFVPSRDDYLELITHVDSFLPQHEDGGFFLQHMYRENWLLQEVSFSLYRPYLCGLGCVHMSAVLFPTARPSVFPSSAAAAAGLRTGDGNRRAAAQTTAGNGSAFASEAVFFFEALGFACPGEEVLRHLFEAKPDSGLVVGHFGPHGLLKLSCHFEMKSTMHTEIVALPLAKALHREMEREMKMAAAGEVRETWAELRESPMFVETATGEDLLDARFVQFCANSLGINIFKNSNSFFFNSGGGCSGGQGEHAPASDSVVERSVVLELEAAGVEPLRGPTPELLEDDEDEAAFLQLLREASGSGEARWSSNITSSTTLKDIIVLNHPEDFVDPERPSIARSVLAELHANRRAGRLAREEGSDPLGVYDLEQALRKSEWLRRRRRQARLRKTLLDLEGGGAGLALLQLRVKQRSKWTRRESLSLFMTGRSGRGGSLPVLVGGRPGNMSATMLELEQGSESTITATTTIRDVPYCSETDCGWYSLGRSDLNYASDSTSDSGVGRNHYHELVSKGVDWKETIPDLFCHPRNFDKCLERCTKARIDGTYPCYAVTQYEYHHSYSGCLHKCILRSLEVAASSGMYSDSWTVTPEPGSGYLEAKLCVFETERLKCQQTGYLSTTRGQSSSYAIVTHGDCGYNGMDFVTDRYECQYAAASLGVLRLDKSISAIG